MMMNGERIWIGLVLIFPGGELSYFLVGWLVG